jgi:hypothetical protein
MADRGAQSTPFSTRLTDFDDALIKRGICSREQCLLAKGMSEDQVLDTLVAEEVELQTRAAEDTLRASLLDRELHPERVREEVASHATVKQLEELEEDDEFADDAFLAKYRQQRISELQEKNRQKVHGEVLEISRDQWTREINAASSLSWVFVHLYEEYVKDCVVLNRVLAEIARKHAQVKFVKIRAQTAVPDWPDGNLPAAYLYKDGAMRKQLVGSREIATGPPPFTSLSVERKLVELGVLKVEDVEDDASEDDAEESSGRRSTYSREDGATWDAS